MKPGIHYFKRLLLEPRLLQLFIVYKSITVYSKHLKYFNIQACVKVPDLCFQDIDMSKLKLEVTDFRYCFKISDELINRIRHECPSIKKICEKCSSRFKYYLAKYS